MSRIGNKIITLPAGVSLDITAGNLVTVKGPKGTLSQQIDQDIIVEIEDNILTVKRPTEQKRHKAMHGLYRSLINNMVVGVSEGFQKDLEIIGVGYKAANQGNILELSLGYSHMISFGDQSCYGDGERKKSDGNFKWN
jgi:large subunit ribosomal protein L6